MQTKALVVIDIQNDITKHYRDIVDNINAAIDWAASKGMQVALYIINYYKIGCKGTTFSLNFRNFTAKLGDYTENVSYNEYGGKAE